MQLQLNQPGRLCSLCGAPTDHSGKGTYCRDCHREYNREWRKRNPDKVAASIERQKRDPDFHAKRAAYARAQRARNPEKHRKKAREWAQRNREARRATDIRVRFGLELDEYRAILAQGCTICGSHYRMCLDHNHANGKVRDALCGPCNSTLGFMKDDPERLRAAAAYLEEHRAPQNPRNKSHHPD